MNTIKHILKVFIVGLTVIMLFIGILMTISIYIKKDKVPFLLNYSYLKVVSGSMEPTIHVNDIIFIKKEYSYEIGDIVTFEVGEELVTHRIIKEEGNGVITKGDNNNAEDGLILKESIIGRVVGTSKILGVFIDIILKPIPMICIFVFMIIIFIIINSDTEEKTKGKRYI